MESGKWSTAFAKVDGLLRAIYDSSEMDSRLILLTLGTKRHTCRQLTTKAQARGADDVARDSGTGCAIPRWLKRFASHHHFLQDSTLFGNKVTRQHK